MRAGHRSLNRLDLTARAEGGKQPKTGVERAVAHAKRAEALALVVWRSEAPPVGTSLPQHPRALPQPHMRPNKVAVVAAFAAAPAAARARRAP